MVLIGSVLAGTVPGVVDLSAGFDREAFADASRRILSRDASRRYTALVPAAGSVLLDAGAALDALTAFDAVLVGGSGSAPELLERAHAANVRVVTSYGMTETCGGCVYDGVALDGVTAATSADGRIKIAGPVLAVGYRLQPELTAQAFVDGWFVSSDLGRIGRGQRLAVFGRVDDVAVTGGVNVPLPAVDRVLAAHPDVAAAAAVALPDLRGDIASSPCSSPGPGPPADPRVDPRIRCRASPHRLTRPRRWCWPIRCPRGPWRGRPGEAHYSAARCSTGLMTALRDWVSEHAPAYRPLSARSGRHRGCRRGRWG